MMPIEQIIKRIELKDYNAQSANHFLYNPVTKAFEPRPPRFGAARLHAYLVTTTSAGVATAEGTLGPAGVQDPTTGLWLKFYVAYQLWVDPRNAQDLVRAVAGDDPGGQLAARLLGAAQHIVGRDPSVLDDHEAGPVAALEREVEQTMLRQCGVTAIVRLRGDVGEGTDKRSPPILVDVDAYVADYPSPVKLTVNVATLVRSRERPWAAEALGRRAPGYLDELVTRACQDAVKDVRAAQLRRDLNGEVAQRVRILLEPHLGSCFIRVSRLTLALREALPTPPDGLEGEIKVDVNVRGYPRSVPLRIPLALQLRDESAYWRSGAPTLAGWVDGEARRVVTRSLHGVTHSQLYLQAAQLQDRVLGAIGVAAGAIGYVVTAHIESLRVPESRFLHPFVLQVADDFESAESSVRLRVEVTLQLKLDALDSVAPYLDAGIDLEAAFRKASHDEIAAYIHTLAPGYAFTQFREIAQITTPLGSDRPDARPAVTVESILRDKVEHALRRRFGLRLQLFTAKLGTSEIQAAYTALLAAPAIDFEVTAQLADHADTVAYRGTVQVEAIRPEDWMAFQRFRPTVETLARAAARAMDTLLHDATAALRFGLPAAQIKALAYNELPGVLRAQLGVTVRCVAWSRERGADDEAAASANRAIRESFHANRRAEYEAWLAEIGRLDRQRRKLLSAGEREQAREVERELDELRRHNPAAADRSNQRVLS